MNRNTKRGLSFAALCASAVLALATSQSRASTISNIGLGPANGGSIGTFSATVALGSGSTLALGNNAISGNYKQHIVFINTNTGFSASNQTAGLSLSPSTVSMSTINSSGTANLTYDPHTPPSPIHLNSMSANLSDGAIAGLTINSSPINMSTSIGTFALTPTFNGTLSGVSFTSTSDTDITTGGAIIPGNFTVILNGSVTGSLSVLGIPISIGTLFTLPTNTAVTFAGGLPTILALSDTGVPHGGNPNQFFPNNMLADFSQNLGSLQIPFSFVAPLATSQTFSVGSSSSGVTSINIQNTTLTANIVLSNLQYHMNGTVNGVLIPEPSSLVLGGIGFAGLLGLAIRRRKAAR
jgi:hypothetical protein